MFSVKQPEGQAFNVNDGFELMNDKPSKTEFPTEFIEAQDRFTEQFAQSLAEKAGGK